MTLDQWLQEATGSFPRGVRERLAQEYGAHLEDSVTAGGSGNAEDLFGKPAIVEKALNKSYIKKKDLLSLEKQPFWIIWLSLGSALLLPIMSLFHRLTLLSALSITIILTTFACIWYVTKNRPPQRRVALRILAAYSILVLTLVEDQLFGSPSSLVTKLLGLVMLLGLFSMILGSLAKDKRIKRTLELEEISLDRRRINLHPDR